MSTVESIVIRGNSVQERFDSIGDAKRQTPGDLYDKLQAITIYCTIACGAGQLVEKMGNRSVSQIFKEFESADISPTPLMSVSWSGKRFAVYKKGDEAKG